MGSGGELARRSTGFGLRRTTRPDPISPLLLVKTRSLLKGRKGIIPSTAGDF
jgi:hypothetical protein